MFSWDNPDVHDMIDRYVKATYLPHLGVKTRPNEASAAEIASVLKDRYSVNFSRHAVRHQFEKHRRVIAAGARTPTVSHKRKVMEADRSSSSPGPSSPLQENIPKPQEPSQAQEPPAKVAKPNDGLDMQRYCERVIYQLSSSLPPFIVRPQHFVPLNNSTWTVDPNIFPSTWANTNPIVNAENFNYQLARGIDPADILPFKEDLLR